MSAPAKRPRGRPRIHPVGYKRVGPRAVTAQSRCPRCLRQLSLVGTHGDGRCKTCSALVAFEHSIRRRVARKGLARVRAYYEYEAERLRHAQRFLDQLEQEGSTTDGKPESR